VLYSRRVVADFPAKLQSAKIPVVARSDCNSSRGYGGWLGPNAFCAGFSSGGVDACGGDSGSSYACLIDGELS